MSIRSLQTLAGVILCSPMLVLAQSTDMPKFAFGSDNRAAFEIQFRASRAGNDTAKAFAGERTAGGIGFYMGIGDTPVHGRFRMDMDFASWQNNQGFETQGIGLDLVAGSENPGSISPRFSIGPTLQRWRTGGIDGYGQAKYTYTGMAGRAEGGLCFGGHLTISLGCLYGSIGQDRRAALTYLALTLH
jgi:hypothetical protein